MTAPLPALAEWENFYVILGSAAAGLTGLMFVVIALAADTGSVRGAKAFRAFASPTVVHFCAVILLAAIVTRPRHSIGSLRACLLVPGVGGLVYAGWVIVQARRQDSYTPVLEDWIWHGCLPVVAYAAIATAGMLVSRAPALALDVVGASALLLLYIGIHNAWDSAVWMTMRRTTP